MASTPPQRTTEQRQAALDKAAEVRRIRSEVKNRLKIGRMTLPELLDEAESDPVVAKIKVVSVLESLPGVGKVQARRTMEELSIAESRKLSGLGSLQRKSLLEAFA